MSLAQVSQSASHHRKLSRASFIRRGNETVSKQSDTYQTEPDFQDGGGLGPIIESMDNQSEYSEGANAHLLTDASRLLNITQVGEAYQLNHTTQ